MKALLLIFFVVLSVLGLQDQSTSASEIIEATDASAFRGCYAGGAPLNADWVKAYINDLCALPVSDLDYPPSPGGIWGCRDNPNFIRYEIFVYNLQTTERYFPKEWCASKLNEIARRCQHGGDFDFNDIGFRVRMDPNYGKCSDGKPDWNDKTQMISASNVSMNLTTHALERRDKPINSCYPRGAFINRDWVRQNVEEACHNLANGSPYGPSSSTTYNLWWVCRNTLFGVRYDFEVINIHNKWNTLSYDFCIGIMEYFIPIHCPRGGDFNFYTEGFRMILDPNYGDCAQGYHNSCCGG